MAWSPAEPTPHSSLSRQPVNFKRYQLPRAPPAPLSRRCGVNPVDRVSTAVLSAYGRIMMSNVSTARSPVGGRCFVGAPAVSSARTVPG
jgi:hypothetical protein